jgi:hypothetical protein
MKVNERISDREALRVNMNQVRMCESSKLEEEGTRVWQGLPSKILIGTNEVHNTN